MAKQKFYVVWNGAEDGVYTTWEACQEAVKGFPGALYKSFKTEEEAEEAFELGYDEWKNRLSIDSEHSGCSAQLVQGQQGKAEAEDVEHKGASEQKENNTPAQTTFTLPEAAINNSIAVDAACSGNPGMMEYRGVYLRTGKEIFHFGPVWGTNNIGEFLAIVHGLALLKQKGLHDMPIYSDSVNAQIWVRKKKCKTTLERNEKTEELFQMIERAEAWLHNNTWRNQIIKWPTDQWGEIPADFGRK